MTIHERVKAARGTRSIAQVARDAEVDPVHLLRFERGERGMSIDRLERVLQAVGIELRGPDHTPSHPVDAAPETGIAPAAEDEPTEPLTGAA